MAKLPKFTLGYDKSQEKWQLTNSQKQVIKRFDAKADALGGGVLQKAIGQAGGSVQIRKVDGTIQEERTFPGSADPKRSPG